MPFELVVPHFGLKFLHSPVKKEAQAWLYIHELFEAICSLQTFSLILTAKVLVAPTLTTGALCTWNSGRVGLLSYHVTAEKIFLKTSVK